MKKDEMKENMCGIQFVCQGYPQCDCVHFQSEDNSLCKHYDQPSAFDCTSAIAQVNAMVLEAKKLGIELVQKKTCEWRYEDGQLFNPHNTDALTKDRYCPFCGGEIDIVK